MVHLAAHLGDGSAAADVRSVLICEHRPERQEDGGFVEQVDVESLVAGSSVVDHGSGVVDLEVLDAALLDGGYRRIGDVEAEGVSIWSAPVERV